MKIVVGIDSFKGSASSIELGNSVKAGFLSAFPSAEVKVFEVADGGEGTLSALKQALAYIDADLGVPSSKMISVATVDLLRRPLVAQYLMFGDLALIETAAVIGIDKIRPDAESVQKASSIGLAALIKDAAARGAKKIYLTLGGSGTSDGGFGLLRGLSVDRAHLTNIPRLPELIGLSDVTNPYAGPTGYAHFFGKQKGGTTEILNEQDKRAQQFAAQVKSQLGIDLQQISGSGAAGGLGGAIAVLGGNIEPGFLTLAKWLKIETEIADADLVITGEGRIDAQTAMGKVPYGMAELSIKHHVPIIALCGSLAEDLGSMEEVMTALYSIQKGPISLEDAMKTEKTLKNLQFLSKNIAKTWFH
ncbi:MAG: glycerate kinase [Streptococcaceae bacterium]|nr:glycerate kinase [Streptococcaceae bacterium]